jgi:hypothetical protein
MGEVISLDGSWRSWFLLRVVVRESFGSWRVVLGGGGGDLWESCDIFWQLRLRRLGWWNLGFHLRRGFSSSLLDLFLVPSCYETGSDGEWLGFAVDCYALESTPRPLVATAVSMRLKKRKANFGIIGLLSNLGHIQSKLDRVLDGLASKPKRWRKRLGFLGLSRGTGGRESGYILEAGSGNFLAPDANLGLDSGVGL